MKRILFTLMSLVLVMLPAMALSAELVTNGGFETGDFTRWTQTPAPSGSDFNVSTTNPHTGNDVASFGAVGKAVTLTINYEYTPSPNLVTLVFGSALITRDLQGTARSSVCGRSFWSQVIWPIRPF